MKLDWRLVLVLVLMMGLMVGCDDPKEDETPFETLSKYMVDNDLDATSVISGWTIAASALSGNEDDYFIVDIRAADKYAEGHIPTAVNSSYADILTTVEDGNTGNLPVVVACYSGQSAAHAVVALRLSGYPDAKSLLYGMSSWARQFDSWTNSCADIAVGHANWSTAAAPALMSGNDDPVITTTQTEGAAILAERVDAILAGFKGTSAATILAEPTNYQILNYWGAADYALYGHIAGAYQVTPETLTIADDGLDILDPNAQIATYCWTGQTSSMVTAWLTALGYDATSLKNGANAMIYNELQGHKWGGPLASDFPME
ncbi:MAG: rhodanese-like domain-containing protein [Candidatus Marinimicrobia bacterium]|nr:rhodanese-like domain-containing protein [Candidatus Neomarinimicrobiota bacterium]